MSDLNLTKARALALFFFAVLAFSPALLAIFSRPVFLFGVPMLYLYLFGVWGLVVAFVGLNAFPGDNDAGRRQTGTLGRPRYLADERDGSG